MAIDRTWYAKGVRFECTGCGQCCKARHGYGYIYVTLEERRRLAQHLGLPPRTFTRRYCTKTDGFFHLRHPSRDCQFLQDNRCTVYAARPGQCRTWPFWPENMSRRVWQQEVRRDCPGIGQGRLYKPAEIEDILAAERRRGRSR